MNQVHVHGLIATGHLYSYCTCTLILTHLVDIGKVLNYDRWVVTCMWD